MFEHLRFQAARIITRSPAGERADKTLLFNDDESVNFRELALDMIELIEQKIRKLRETIAGIDRESGARVNDRATLSSEKQAIQTELARLEDHLRRLGALS